MDNNKLHLLEELLEFYDINYYSYCAGEYFNNAACINKVDNMWEVCDFRDDEKHKIKKFKNFEEASYELITRLESNICRQDEMHETLLMGLLFV